LRRVAGDRDQALTTEQQLSITLLPPFVIENMLACEVDFKVLDKATTRMQKQGKIDSGKDLPLHEVAFSRTSVALLKISIPGIAKWN
jgi:hypothetical protein